jgi:hypothetical protein
VIGRDWVGPLAGTKDYGVVQTSFARTNVTGNWQVGGLIGMIEKMAIVQSNYATGTVTGVNRTGGFVGAVDFGAIVRNSYATGAVNGVSSTGGFAGYFSQSSVPGSVQTSYSTGAVTGSTKTGGLVGEIYAGSGATVTSSYWDTVTSGVATSDGGAGLTTAQLQGALPTGFSASVWGTGAGQYPFPTLQFAPGTSSPPTPQTPPTPGTGDNVRPVVGDSSSMAAVVTSMVQNPSTNSVIDFMPVVPPSAGQAGSLGSGTGTGTSTGTTLFYADERFGE